MWFFMAVLLITFVSSLALYLVGVKESKGKTLAVVKNNPGYPRLTPSDTFEHKGTFTMGGKEWPFDGTFFSQQIALLCQDGQADYSNGTNCTLNVSYAQSKVSFNFKIMIASAVIFVLYVVYLIRNWMSSKKQQRRQSRQQQQQ